MLKQKFGTLGLAMMMTLMSLSGGLAAAADRTPMTPELAAKREMVRKQHKQRVTQEQRKTAAETLKAERIKIYKARQAAQGITPVTTDNK